MILADAETGLDGAGSTAACYAPDCGALAGSWRCADVAVNLENNADTSSTLDFMMVPQNAPAEVAVVRERISWTGICSGVQQRAACLLSVLSPVCACLSLCRVLLVNKTQGTPDVDDVLEGILQLLGRGRGEHLVLEGVSAVAPVHAVFETGDRRLVDR